MYSQNSFLLIAIVTILVAAVVVVMVSADQSYDSLCAEIVNLGKRSAQYANRGDMDAALNTVEEAKSVSKLAIQKEPKNPQAYVDIGILLLNANFFNESIDSLENALQLLPPAPPMPKKPPTLDRKHPDYKKTRPKMPHDPYAKNRASMQRQIQMAKYGYCSKNRDDIYKKGAGDVSKAYEWARRQIDVTPLPHRTYFEAGTLAAILCEYDESMCENADAHLRIASNVAFHRYKSILREPTITDRSKKLQCRNSKLRVGAWLGAHPKIKSKTVLESVYIHEIEGTPMMLNGPDGVLTFLDEGHCEVLSPASDYYLDLGRNLMPQERLSPPQRRISDGMIVLSAVQYHAHSFYHWMCEVIPRLIVASIHWEKWKKAVILIPKLSANERFITESMSLIFDDKVQLAEYEPFTQMSQIAYVHWDAPECPHKVGPCHALAKPLALHLARNEIVRAIRRSPWNSLKYAAGIPVVVFAMRGNNVTMRNYDETRFMVKLENAVMKAGGMLVAHNSEKMVFGNSLAAYRQADVVVGVHGGALSNIMACTPGTTVIEIGFAAAFARHYSHVASALALEYQFVEVTPDLPLKRSVGAPSITFDEAHVIDSIIRAIPSSMENKKRYSAEFEQDTNPKVDPREELDEQERIDREAEQYFNDRRGPPDSGNEEVEEHGGNGDFKSIGGGEQQHKPLSDEEMKKNLQEQEEEDLNNARYYGDGENEDPKTKKTFPPREDL